MNRPTIRTFQDERGEMKFLNTCGVPQILSVNHQNVFRGIHCSPYGKHVTCLTGEIQDFVIDPSEGTVQTFHLRANDQIYVPPHFGHAFLSLTEGATMLYQLEGTYDPCRERNIHYLDPYLHLPLPPHVIVSDKDKSHPFLKPIDYVVLGSSGFLGSETCKYLKRENKHFLTLSTRLEDISTLAYQLKLYRPKYVICAAGISGKPTVKWCDDHRAETLHVNLTLQLQLAELCRQLGIHLTLYGSGLVFEGDRSFTEHDTPNLTSLYYSQVRGLLEHALQAYPDVLYLRILYPVSGSGHVKCFLAKMLTRLNSVHNIRVNITVLPDLLPRLFHLVERGTKGVLNFVNHGTVSLPQLVKICGRSTFRTVETKTRPPSLTTDRLKALDPNALEVITALKRVVKQNSLHDHPEKDLVLAQPV